MDGYLTPGGLHQIEVLRSYFSTAVFDRVYASSLGRAIQTAQVLSSSEGRVRIAEWVRERGTCPPGAANNPGESISATHQRISEGWRAEIGSIATGADIEGRVFAVQPPPLKIAIVAHGGSLFHLLCLMLGLCPQEGYTPINFMNTGVALVYWTLIWNAAGWHPTLWMPSPEPSCADLIHQLDSETASAARLILGGAHS